MPSNLALRATIADHIPVLAQNGLCHTTAAFSQTVKSQVDLADETVEITGTFASGSATNQVKMAKGMIHAISCGST